MLTEVIKHNHEQEQTAWGRLIQGIGNVAPDTAALCKECIKEGTTWVAPRMCLSGGHVGCCDSSPGMHSTRHYSETDHPVIVALPNKVWRSSYVHKIYG